MEFLLQPLTLLTFLPLVGVLVILFINAEQKAAIRWTAMITSLVTFAASLWVFSMFNASNPDLQLEAKYPWIQVAGWNIYYYLAVDGLSILLVLLTGFLTPISILSTWKAVDDRVKDFMIFFLLLEVGMMGVFLAQDLFLFYIFWEFTLVPMYFLIGIWGGPRRVYAAVKFFLYTMAGSILMLLAIIFLGIQANTFNVPEMLTKLPALYSAGTIPAATQMLLFVAFAAAFAIKVPMWPLHSWLPDAHVEAPTAGSVILAGVLLKMGTYGFLRFNIQLFPDATVQAAPWIALLATIGIIYGAMVSYAQQDVKKLVAYSSVAHMGFVTLGFFIFIDLGVSGGLVQMIAHGFVSGAMFLSIGVLYDRVHSREIASYGGVVNTMPKFTAFALFFAMANCGLPGTAGFVGEWMVILAAVKYNFWVGFAAASALIFGAAYTLWMFKRVYLGPIANDHVRALADINAREFLMLALLAGAVLWMGVHPKPFTDVMDVSVAQLLKHVAVSKLN